MRTAVWILVLGLSACSSSSPTAPTPPAPPVAALPPADRIVAMSVLGNQWIATNSGPVQMTARVFTRLGSSEGPGEFVDTIEHVTWSVDPAGVVAVDRQGRVTPVANGTARVIATLGERSASNSVRVLPDYAGSWTGKYFITGCTGLPDPRTCGRNMFDISTGVRLMYPIAVTLAQDRDQMTGFLEQTNSANDTARYPVTGFVRLNGALVLEGTLPPFTFVPALQERRLFNWSSSMSGAPPRLSGGYSTSGESATTFGTRYLYRIEHEFIGLSRAN